MSWYMGAAFVVGACLLVLFIGFFKNRAELAVNFLLRTVLGAIAIYSVNLFLKNLGISGGVGLNVFTLLTSGFLGFPGVFLLYGIRFFLLL